MLSDSWVQKIKPNMRSQIKNKILSSIDMWILGIRTFSF